MNTYEVKYKYITKSVKANLFTISSDDYLYFYSKQNNDLEMIAAFAPGKWDNVFFISKDV